MRPRPFGVERWFGKYEFTTGLNIAESCIKPLTVDEIRQITGRDLAAETAGMPLGYTECNGNPALRRAIAALYPGLSEDSVMVTNGAIEANYLAFAAQLEPGDGVIAVYPAYQQLHEIPASLGASIKKWPMRRENGWAPDLDELKELVDDRTRLIVLNFPHNPTGFAPEPEFIRDVCRFAAERGIAVHSDEVYRGLRLDGGEPSPSALEFLPEATVVGSTSKAFGLSGARIGWVVGTPGVVRRCLEHRDYVSICPPVWSEVVAQVVLENRDRVLARNRRLALENSGILEEWAKENVDIIGLVPPLEGVVCFPWLKFPASSEEFCSSLVEAEDVLLVPGSRFDTEGHFRIGFGYATEKLAEGLRRLTRFTRRYAGRG
ncbi:MAG: aminotransferase class I/II-fold pyridoxal phosphate-dependent enzyme [Firmicutes bacterium]|nr:aminotransferase class I/II-fold pyridoxal phosphate-dependent enzyme [Bacillota bacterium]